MLSFFIRSVLKSGFGLFILFTLLVFGFEAKAGEVAIGSSAQFVNITPFVDYYEDASGELGIEDISSGRIYNEFTPIRSSAFHAGFSSSTYWFRVRLGLSQSVGGGNRWLLEIPKLNTGEVVMYVPDFTKTGGYSQSRAPALFTDYDEPFFFRNVVFPLSSNVAGKTIFFKVKNEWSVSMPFYIWEDGAYRKEVAKRALFFALGCGMMLGAAIFCVFALPRKNWKIISLFGFYNLLWLAFLCNVRGYSLLFFNNPPLLFQSTGLLLFGADIVGVLLTIHLLNLKIHAPRIYRAGLVFLALPVIGISLSFVLPRNIDLKMVMAGATLIGLYKLCAASVRLRQRSRPGFWFFVSWLMLYGGLLAFFCNGFFWPYSPAIQDLLVFVISLSSLIVCLAIIMEYGVQEFKNFGPGGQDGGLEQHDISTGLYSQAYFISRFMEEINHSHRVRQPLSLLLIDLDHLRQVNEKYGVLFSDQVIVALGEIIKENALRFSAGGRLGGGHFALQLPEVSLKDALEVAEKIRNEFSSIDFSAMGYSFASDEQDTEPETGGGLPGDGGIRFSVCIGVVEVLSGETRWDEVVKRAQDELQKAKDLGENMIYPDPSIRDLL